MGRIGVRSFEHDGSQGGGLTSLTMRHGEPGRPRPPGGGEVNVTVEPSNRISQDRPGVYVRVNDHYTIEDVESQMATSEIVTLLEENFDKSLQNADKNH